MKKSYTVKASATAKKNNISAASNPYFALPEFPVETWDILERNGFTNVGENDELYAASNGDDLIVSDGRFCIAYYSNIPSGEKDQLLADMIEEDCFPDLPENFSNVEETEYYSIGELFDDIVGDL